MAIGEIGLDFHYDHSPRDAQREAFRRQIRLAREVGLPIVVHTREADEETVEILEGEGAAEAGGVIHCFTGGLELGRRALGLGFLISFSGIVAFPRAEVIQQVARETPTTGSWSRPTPPSSPRPRTAGRGTSPRSSWTWRARWRPCGAPRSRPWEPSLTATTRACSGARSSASRV